MFKIGDIVKRKYHAGNKLNNEQKEGNAAGIVPDFVFMYRYEFMFSESLCPFNIVAFFEPVLKPLAVQP